MNSIRLLFSFLIFTIVSPSLAQTEAIEKLHGMKARSIGPAGMAGRVTSIDVVNDQPEVIYVGTASGGLWKSENAGISWEPIFDDQTTASIGAVAIQQSNPSVIWVGTGEGNPRNSLNGGDGLYRSLDGGHTWRKIGLENTRHIHRIIIDPTNPEVVYVGAIGSPWGIHPERGVYKTEDGGKSWQKILYINDKTGVADLVMDPTNPNKLIAAMWEHYRQPWHFTSGGEGSGMHITHDGGKTWKKVTEKDGLPKGNLGRMGLAIAPSNPKRIYALIESEKNALYGSDDGGISWSVINDKSEIGNRPFYYSDIYVDPVNEYRLYSLFSYVNVSNDGGKSFERLMPAYYTTRGVHPDHHAWWIHPDDPNFIIEGNDGGLNISRDRGKTWRFVQNLPVAQFYHISVDNDIPYNVYGGMQDNGSWAGPAYVWKDQGIRNSYWQEISFGDGFDVVPDPDNLRYGYSMSQEGYVSRYDRETGYNEIIRPTAPDLDTKLRFNWNAAIAQNPFDNNSIYFGSQFVHKSTDKGQNWTIISPDLTTNDPKKQRQDESGGLTMDATGAENYCTILAIEPSSLNKDVIWVTTDDGNIQITRDGGKSWTKVSDNIKGLPKNVWIPQIRASKNKPGEALVVANNYRNFDYTPYAYRTTDFGKSWERIVDGSDVVGYTLSIIEDTVNPKLMFLGTDDGLYFSIDKGANWTKWTQGFPTVNAMDLAIHPRENDLIIGTFGRAAYVLDDIQPLRDLAVEGPELLDRDIHLFKPQTAYLATIQQPLGTRFGADAIFNGENRKSGALISYVFNQNEESDKEEPDSLYLKIYDQSDLLIQTLTQVAPEKNGLNKWQWKLDEKGVDDPYRKDEKGENENQISVLPGKYKLVLEWKGQQSTTEIEVKSDPRLDLSFDILQAKYDALKALEDDKEIMLGQVNQLKNKFKITDELIRRMKDKSEKSFEEQIKLANTEKDSINSLLDLYLGKEDDRQGITADQTDHVFYYYRQAFRYIDNARHAPTANEKALTDRFKLSLSEANEQVTNYLADRWPDFKEEMSQLDLSPFDE